MLSLTESKKSIIGLMGSCLMNNVLYMFLNTFMVAYFITLTNYNYKIISIYYIISFIFIMISFLLLGKIVKNRAQVSIFRIGIILHCIYVLTIALLKENIVVYYMYLGAFYGIVQGFFWSAGHPLLNEYTRKEANNFISLRSIIGKVLKICFPIIFGVSIELTSFSYIARVVLIISLIQFMFSLLITDKQHINNKKYDLVEFIKYVKTKKRMKKFYKISVCDGIVTYLLETLITILIVMTFKTTISLGILTTVFSICSMVSIYIFQRKLKNNTKILKISTVAMIISVMFLLFDINKITIIIYNLCNNIFLVLLINNVEEKRYSIVNDDKNIIENYLVEHQVMAEINLNVSRIIGYFILFIASLFNNMIVFKILLFLVTIVIVIYSKLMISLNKENSKLII